MVSDGHVELHTMSYEILDSLQDSNLGVSYIVDVAQHDVETPRSPSGEWGSSL